MLVACRVDDVPCTVDDFVYVPNIQYGGIGTLQKCEKTSLGACWSYVGGMKGKANAFGPLKGLVMVFDIQPEEYLPRHAEQDSLVVVIDHMNYFPRPEIKGIPVGPGGLTETNRKMRIFRYGHPHWRDVSQNPAHRLPLGQR